jgi:DNA-binding PadR family transcriptional regulator
VNPGSIYSGLRTLTRHGLLAEESGDPVSYRLTADGETEYQRLMSQALREPAPGEPSRLLAGLCFLTTLPRDEVREALRARALVLEAMVSASTALIRSVEQKRMAPASTVELSSVVVHWLGGEQAWLRELCARIDAGHYRFAGEPGAPDRPDGGTWPPAVLDPPGTA